MTDKNNTKTVRVKDKIKAIYPHIVVGGKIDKPCFSIHWYDVKKKEMYIGYSSYNLNYVREWLKENFEIVEPEIDNLINRQKAEIEKLKGSTIVSNIMESQRIKREAKAEAYKEFATQLKCGVPYDTGVIRCKDVDEILKKMIDKL